MKALVLKELRENVKLAALGLVIYALLLVLQYRESGDLPRTGLGYAFIALAIGTPFPPFFLWPPGVHGNLALD